MNIFNRGITGLISEKQENDPNERDAGFEIIKETSVQSEPPVLAAIESNIINNSIGMPYGISDVAKLIQTLPKSNIDKEISVVIRTISSFNVDINSIIEDGCEKQQLVKSRLELLNKEIEELQAKIDTRNEEIKLLKVGLSEITKSQEYLARGVNVVNQENEKKSVEKNKKSTAPAKKRRTRAKKSTTVPNEVEMAKTKEFNVINLDTQPKKRTRSKVKKSASQS